MGLGGRRGSRRFVRPVRSRLDADILHTDGSVVKTTLGWPARAQVVSKRVAAAVAQPTRAELERYAGSYYSEELGVTYAVTATDSTLVLKSRWGAGDRTVRMAFGDTFVGDYLLRFTRGKGGRIEGMLMSSGRARGVRFERTR